MASFELGTGAGLRPTWFYTGWIEESWKGCNRLDVGSKDGGPDDDDDEEIGQSSSVISSGDSLHHPPHTSAPGDDESRLGSRIQKTGLDRCIARIHYYAAGHIENDYISEERNECHSSRFLIWRMDSLKKMTSYDKTSWKKDLFCDTSSSLISDFGDNLKKA